MNQMNLTDFFVMEASEYLEQLDAIVSSAGPPVTGEFVRLARALKGSALMAKRQAISEAAGALENLARGVDEGRIPWDSRVQQLGIRGVDDLKILVRAAREWSEDHEAKARSLAQELDSVTGRRSAASAPPVQGLDAGTRAFIGREGAALASALDQAAKSLQQDPADRESVDRVLKAMQPLRGLAILGDLPPMSDLLDGIESAAAEVMRRSDPVSGADLLFNAGAKALARAAQEISAEGSASPDSSEARDFAHRLGALLEVDEDIVSISSLYYDDEGPHVVREGTVSGRPAQLGRLELVSHGEHLKKTADDLERAASETQRELRLQSLAGTFRALGAMAGGPLQDKVAELARVSRETVTSGAALERTVEFARALRDAGRILSGAGEEDEAQQAARLGEIVDWLRALPAGEPAEAEVQPTVGVLSRPRADSVVGAQRPTTEPAEPLPETPTPAAAAPAAPAEERDTGEEVEEPPDLAGSWQRYERYAEHLGLGEPSLHELLAGPPADPRRAAATAPAGPPTVETGGEELVDITSLCYSGRAALERAVAIRSQVREALAAADADDATVTELIEEIFDLVELGLEG
ncbi:MAG: hypothetical protein ACE5PT_01305 [Gemmatimonadales bacterium]